MRNFLGYFASVSLSIFILTVEPSVGAPSAPHSDPTRKQQKKDGVFEGNSQSAPWLIKKTQWEEEDYEEYQRFIFALGTHREEEGCSTLKNCLESSANFLYDPKDSEMFTMFADCADLPDYLLAYFSWKKGLPFAILSDVVPRTDLMDLKPQDPSAPVQEDRNIRYSPKGNIPRRIRSVFVQDQDRIPSAADLLNRVLVESIHSGFFRILGDLESPLPYPYYPIKLERGSIRPGTVIYDPNGHIAIVYRISRGGRILFIDSHPDNSITWGIYSDTMKRGWPGQGAGLKNSRPLKLVSTVWDEELGSYVGGKIRFALNSELSDYSLEGQFGNDPNSLERSQDPTRWKEWSEGKFITKKKEVVNFHTYLKSQLMDMDQPLDPLDETQLLLKGLCATVRERVKAVDLATKNGLNAKPMPLTLPSNVYGAIGEWEAFATPARDFRLKGNFIEVKKEMASMLVRMRSHDPSISYTGSNPALDLLKVYQSSLKACPIRYNNSINKRVTISLEDVRLKIFKMSFDPYQCVELRWGEPLNESASGSCSMESVKWRWYQVEQFFRNELERSEVPPRTDISIEEAEEYFGEKSKLNQLQLDLFNKNSEILNWLKKEANL